MKRFEKFMKDEYNFVYENCENMEVLLDGFDLSDHAKERIRMDMFDKIIPKAVEDMVNNDYFWQTIHEEMDVFLINVIKEYIASLDFE